MRNFPKGVYTKIRIFQKKPEYREGNNKISTKTRLFACNLTCKPYKQVNEKTRTAQENKYDEKNTD